MPAAKAHAWFRVQELEKEPYGFYVGIQEEFLAIMRKDKPAGAALRATFIVDPDGIIQHVTVNNLNVGRNPEETLRILDALQTGELCQCNRQVGEATLSK